MGNYLKLSWLHALLRTVVVINFGVLGQQVAGDDFDVAPQAASAAAAAEMNDLFSQVLEECNGHLLHLQSLLRKMQEDSPNDQTSKNADHFGALMHHLAIVKNKCCLMTYVYNRAEVIQHLRWTIERVLPEEIEEKLSNPEKYYFKNHSAALQAYMFELDLDLAVANMVPPKDPYIKVRVLEEIGNVVLSDQIANLSCHEILFLRQTDAEHYISQMECTYIVWVVHNGAPSLRSKYHKQQQRWLAQ